MERRRRVTQEEYDAFVSSIRQTPTRVQRRRIVDSVPYSANQSLLDKRKKEIVRVLAVLLDRDTLLSPEVVAKRMLSNPYYNPLDPHMSHWNPYCHPRYGHMDRRQRSEHLQTAIRSLNIQFHTCKRNTTALGKILDYADAHKAIYSDWIKAQVIRLRPNKIYLTMLHGANAERSYLKYVAMGKPKVL